MTKEDASNPQPVVKTMPVDTHCHPFLMDGEPERAVETAFANGVGILVSVGIDPRSSDDSATLAERFPGRVFATAGMHPHTASELTREAQSDIESLSAKPQVVGIGETGLDFFRMKSPQADQEAALRFHAEVSRNAGKPLVVHVRDAWLRALEILEEERADRVVLHCFSGDETIARECEARGYFLSFAGPITYPKNESLRAAAAAVSADRILTETDSPYLPPQSLRGRDNVPANVMSVVEELASVRKVTVEDVLETTFSNAKEAFGGF